MKDKKTVWLSIAAILVVVTGTSLTFVGCQNLESDPLGSDKKDTSKLLEESGDSGDKSIE